MSSCIQIRDWQDSESMSELFGIAVSLESPAAWEGVWRTLTEHAALVLREYLDIDLGENSVGRSNYDQLAKNGRQVPVVAEDALALLLERLSLVNEHGVFDTSHFAGLIFFAKGHT